MRKAYDPVTGSDVTTTVQAALQSGRTLVTQYLYTWLFPIFWKYNPFQAFAYYVFTDANWPIFINYLQQDSTGVSKPIGYWLNGTLQPVGLTYQPENLFFDKLSYGIGFEDKPVEVTFSIDDSKVYWVLQDSPLTGVQKTDPSIAQCPAGLTLKMCFSMGAFSETPFWIHEAIYTDFPSRGGTLLGTVLMFRGYIRETKVTSSQVKLSLASLMDMFQQIPIPTQTITMNARSIPYLPGGTPLYGSDFGQFPTIITPQIIDFSTAEVIPAHAMRDYSVAFNPAGFGGFPVFLSGAPASPLFKVQDNDASTGSVCRLYFYSPVIIPTPQCGGVNFFAPMIHNGPNPGFPEVPPPEYALT